ncbi:hypothetical protein AALB39_21560 [Lachnospiraceae bacterium 54-53]
MSSYTELIISPENLRDGNIFQTTITIDRSKEVLMTGTVYNSQRKAIEGAVIQITEIHPDDYRVNKGFVITNRSGEFALTVTKSNCINYQLVIYEPLMAVLNQDEHDGTNI